MRVVIAPDSFAGSLTAPDAAAAIAQGWRRQSPHDALAIVPLSDGGPGFVAAMARSIRGDRFVNLRVRDPLFSPALGRILIAGDTAYVESAHACGLHLVRPPRDPRRTTTTGVGDLIRAAMEASVKRVVVGLGGSGTNDGGAGVLQVLGVKLLDGRGRAVPARGGALVRLERVEVPDPWPPDIEVVAATDVDNPLLGPEGATAVYAPQKGANAAAVEDLEAALAQYAAVTARDVPGAAGLAEAPGAGAAGGLGYGLMLLGARPQPGIEVVLQAVGFEEGISTADLVVTGEGTLDEQSLHGKVVAGVAAAANAAGIPCVVVAGNVRLDADQLRAAGIAAAFSAVGEAGSEETSLLDPRRYLAAAAARAAREAPAAGAPAR